MNPTNFPEANTRFGAPPDLSESQCLTIKAYVGVITGGSLDGCQVVVTAWLPTPAELEALNRGNPLFLSFIGSLPPHYPCVTFHGATHPA